MARDDGKPIASPDPSPDLIGDLAASTVHPILGIRLIHHGKIRVEPYGFPVGSQQSIGHGVKGPPQTVPSVRLPDSPKAPCDTSQATRAARVLVLPVPAPAMVRTGPSPAVAARSCSGFQFVNPRFGHCHPRGYVPPRPTYSR